MKPTKFELVMADDVVEFQERINELLKEGYIFIGDLRIENGVFIYGMIKMEQVMQAPVPEMPAKSTKKEEKK